METKFDSDNSLRSFTARHSPEYVGSRQRENAGFVQRDYQMAWNSHGPDPQLKHLFKQLAEKSLESMNDLQDHLQMLDLQQQASSEGESEGEANGQSDK